MLFMWGPAAATGRGRSAHPRRGRRPGLGTAARASGAAPRPCQVGDRPLHQRAQPRLQPVIGPLGVAEPVDGAAVPDRGMPALARLGQPTESAVQQAGDLDVVQHLVQPRQHQQLVLVAASRSAAVHPQQVTPDRADRQPLGGVGVALEVVQDLLVGPASGSLHQGRQPSTTTALPQRASSASSSRRSSRVVTKLPSGWQDPTRPRGQAAGPGYRPPRSWRCRPRGRRAIRPGQRASSPQTVADTIARAIQAAGPGPATSPTPTRGCSCCCLTCRPGCGTACSPALGLSTAAATTS